MTTTASLPPPVAQASWLVIHEGNSPLICSVPHAGIVIPPAYQGSFISEWAALRDCDWWINHLYEFARDLDATMIQTRISRSVIDVNRPADNSSLYPGQASTSLCPTTNFDGEPLYLAGKEPDSAETAQRKQHYYLPYHAALQAQINRLKANYQHLVLYDCHSIRSRIPRLFPDLLPPLNIGTNNGRSCSPDLQMLVASLCQNSTFDYVINGRFKGGAITRQYGQPEQGVHAIQMEIACRAYLQEPDTPLSPQNWPPFWSLQDSATLRATLSTLLQALQDWAAHQN